MRNLTRTLILCLIAFSAILQAQPSGGPYGPVQQTYELPKVKGTIYYVAVDGNAKASGKSLEKPTTIEAAISKVSTGDAIVLRGGVYRTGDLQLNQGITMQPYRDEKPVLKGTLLATDWQQQENGLWVTQWQHLFPDEAQSWWRRHRHGSDVPQHRFNNDLVFVDGRFLQSAGWEGGLDDNSYYINYETKTVYLSFDPREHEVEITAFNIGLQRTTGEVHGKKSDGRGPVIRGITFTQYAQYAIDVQGYYPEKLSKDSEHGKDVIGTLLEHCTLSYSARVGGNFKGDSLIIRNCKVSDTSTEGIYVVASSDVLLEKNILTRNNIEQLQGYYPAAVKIFNQSYRVTCRDNLVTDQQNSTGIWYDVGNVDGVFINNWLEDIHYDETHRKPGDVWPIGAGFFFEISRGAVCAGNVFINCDAGIHLRNAADVEIVNNTFVNSQVLIGRTERTAQGDHFDWHPSTGPGIDERDGHVFMNNLLYADANYIHPLLKVWQREILCEKFDIKTPQLDKLDHNVYVRKTDNPSNPLIYWSPAKDECFLEFTSLAKFHDSYPDWAKNSAEYTPYNGALFRSSELGYYQLLNSFSGVKQGTKDIPAKLQELGFDGGYVGAYPSFQIKR
ncbi:right-handed parallel beta-helix repeat-containing protein [candidate division KSB1 bacterium]|nr:right-handed parallel beta-helix repeat-containing protein [candidate division KSB1 bacterium]